MRRDAGAGKRQISRPILKNVSLPKSSINDFDLKNPGSARRKAYRLLTHAGAGRARIADMTDDRATRRFMGRLANWCEPVDGLCPEEVMLRGPCFPLKAPAMTRTLAALDLPKGILFPAAPHGGARE